MVKIKSFVGLFSWTLSRYKVLFAVLSGVQALFSIAIFFGVPLLLGKEAFKEGSSSPSSLVAATWLLSAVVIGLSLCPQIVAEAKTEGYVDYVKNLSVSRGGILISEVLSWVLLSLPGVAFIFLVGWLRFGQLPSFNATIISALLLALVVYSTMGYSIALAFRLEFVQFVSQATILIALLFTPLLYPAQRLPSWMISVHEFLPFYSAFSLLRAGQGTSESTFQSPYFALIVVAVWGLGAIVVAIALLKKRI